MDNVKEGDWALLTAPRRPADETHDATHVCLAGQFLGHDPTAKMMRCAYWQVDAITFTDFTSIFRIATRYVFSRSDTVPD